MTFDTCISSTIVLLYKRKTKVKSKDKRQLIAEAKLMGGEPSDSVTRTLAGWQPVKQQVVADSELVMER